jgi:DnaJ-class molecular chaperone
VTPQHALQATDADRARFQHMKEAYDVLADPRRRELYDQLGETGLRMMEDPASLSPEKVQKLSQKIIKKSYFLM